jgi:quinol-cytochrome oxidoreductase complex cytochrome b subunit
MTVRIGLVDALLGTSMFFVSPVWILLGYSIVQTDYLFRYVTFVLIMAPALGYLALLYCRRQQEESASEGILRKWRILIFLGYLVLITILTVWLVNAEYDSVGPDSSPHTADENASLTLFWCLVPLNSLSLLVLTVLSARMGADHELLGIRILMSTLLILMTPLNFLLFFRGT